jgi:hypothetical protein
VARIYKVKYYPRGSVTEAQTERKPYFAWKSMESAKHAVHHGMIWRVGDGKDIWIWGDCWLPTPSSFTVQSPKFTI